MNQMISSEVSLYMALALAGAGGYVFVQWASLSFCPQRSRVSTAKADKLEVADVKPAAGQRGLKSRSRARGRCNGVSPQVAPAPRDQEGSISTFPPEVVIEKVEEALQKEVVEPAVESQRVARLLAKKAERKARKAHQRLQQDVSAEAGEVADEVATVQVDDVASESRGSEKCLDQKAACQDVNIADLSTGDETSVQVDDVTSESSGSEKCLNQKSVCQDVNIADLSTGDETLMGLGNLEETEEESLDEEGVCEFDKEQPAARQAPCSPEFAPYRAAVWTSDEEFQGLYHPMPGDDSWMAPLDGVIRSREEAERVYSEVMAGMCIGSGVAHVPDTLYQVVLCDGQKFYSDGEQLYMLAYADSPADTVLTAPQLLRPVVDAHDPLHMEFAMDHQQGLDQLSWINGNVR